MLRLQGVKYNIPVQVWLPEAYARQPPIMYVVPTSTMIIKPSHSFVDASGVVSSPLRPQLDVWQVRPARCLLHVITHV